MSTFESSKRGDGNKLQLDHTHLYLLAEIPSEDLKIDAGEHIEADIKLPRHVVEDLQANVDSGPASQAMGTQDAAGPSPDADMNMMSSRKSELTPILTSQLRQSFRRQGLEAVETNQPGWRRGVWAYSHSLP